MADKLPSLLDFKPTMPLDRRTQPSVSYYSDPEPDILPDEPVHSNPYGGTEPSIADYYHRSYEPRFMLDTPTSNLVSPKPLMEWSGGGTSPKPDELVKGPKPLFPGYNSGLGPGVFVAEPALNVEPRPLLPPSPGADDIKGEPVPLLDRDIDLDPLLLRQRPTRDDYSLAGPMNGIAASNFSELRHPQPPSAEGGERRLSESGIRELRRSVAGAIAADDRLEHLLGTYKRALNAADFALVFADPGLEQYLRAKFPGLWAQFLDHHPHMAPRPYNGPGIQASFNGPDPRDSMDGWGV